jgi:DnaJ domain
MKLKSPYFDSIRASGKPGTTPPAAERARGQARCQWKGCEAAGDHRAPKGRGHDGEYYVFCIDHVRQYNASYNYFQGMSDTEVQDFQKDAMTGHRPTWKVGANAWSHGTRDGMTPTPGAQVPGGGRTTAQDPHAFFAWRARSQREAAPESRRQLRPLEKKALATLDLDDKASGADIKARFKALVKRHHPDTNGGSGSEERLREIISAYNHLKQAGLV